jgi:hypothetical protein
MLLTDRARLARRTVDRFGKRPFGYGKNDCIAMAHFHLTGAGLNLPPMPPYKTALGAKKALARRGFDNLEGLIDNTGLERITPAKMLVGDIATLQGDLFSAVVIHCGDMAFGWHERGDTHGLPLPAMMIPLEYIAAWRLPWQKS